MSDPRKGSTQIPREFANMILHGRPGAQTPQSWGSRLRYLALLFSILVWGDVHAEPNEIGQQESQAVVKYVANNPAKSEKHRPGFGDHPSRQTASERVVQYISDLRPVTQLTEIQEEAKSVGPASGRRSLITWQGQRKNALSLSNDLPNASLEALPAPNDETNEILEAQPLPNDPTNKNLDVSTTATTKRAWLSTLR